MNVTIYEGYKSYTQEELIDLMDRIKVIIYARVSTPEQLKGYSISSQIDLCVELGLKKGYKQNEILAVVEKGEMGDNPDRPALNHVLELIEAGIGRMLVMLHPNRMSRYLTLQNMIADKIWSAGCEIQFVEFDVDPDNPESMLMFNVQGSISQYNKAKILADTKRGRKKKVKEGMLPGIRRVFGYTFDKENDILIENTNEKTTYLQMIEWLFNGDEKGEEMNCSKIARKLAEMNIPAPESTKWYQSTVSRILRSPIYLGTFYWGKTETVQKKGKKIVIDKPKEQWFSVKIPQYIDQGTYDKLQKKLDSLVKKSRGRKSGNYLLKGFVRCGKCGSAVVAGPPTALKKGGKIRYYSCSNKSKKNYEVGTGKPNKTCSSGYWRQDTVDDYVWFYVLDRLRNPEQIIADIVKQQGDTARIKNIEEQITKIEGQITKKNEEHKRCFKAYKEGLIPLDILKEEIQPIKNKINELEKEHTYQKELHHQISMSYDELEQIKMNIKIFEEMVKKDIFTFEQKREIVKKVIEKVILREDKIEIVTKWIPEETNAETPRKLSVGQGYGGL